MKFKALPVLSLEDATVDFEQLQTLDILNRKIAAGMSSFTFAASTSSGIVTITHGLGVTPITVQLTCADAGSIVAAGYGALGSTTFQAQAFASTPLTTTLGFSWLAIG